MIDEAKQTENTENKQQEAPQAISSDRANAAEIGSEQPNEFGFQETLASEIPSPEVEAALDTLEWEEMEAEIATLKQQMETLKAQLEERTNQYVRIAADFDNFRKRTQKEKEELEAQVKCSTLSGLLTVVDNFERAQAQIKPQTDQEKNIHKSYQSIYKQLVSALKSLGVSPMRPKGKVFDPNLHEAAMREATNEYPEGTVTEELVPGYYLGERVLRHATVKVAAAPDPVITSEESQDNTLES